MKVPPSSGQDTARKRLGYTKQDVKAATGRSVSTIEADARDPLCPLKFRAYPNQRAKVASVDSFERYLAWLEARATAAGGA